MARSPIKIIVSGVSILAACVIVSSAALPGEKSLFKEIFSADRQVVSDDSDAGPQEIPFKTWFPTEKPATADDTSGDKLGPAPAILPTVPVDAEHMIKSGDTLKGVLTQAGVSPHEAELAIQALKKVYDPRRLQPGHRLYLELLPADSGAKTKELLSIDFRADPTQDISVLRENDGSFSAEVYPRAVNTGIAYASGRISSSLYKSGTRAGLPNATLINFIHMFSFDVDFQREIQPGDSFEVLYERFSDDAGTTVGEGDILIASLTLSGNNMTLYRFKTDKGFTDYFNAEGQSAQKSLLRTPTDATRISSGFGRRLHPILGYTRMHKGVDFAAPAGTPIYAAGDGVIEKAGWAGGYGKYIRIRHNGTYKTAYGHMRAFARGIKAGVRVKQRQVIGYVGATGRATGPHLHYEVHFNGHQIDPKKVRLPSGYHLTGAELERFQTVVKNLRDRLANLRNGVAAKADSGAVRQN